MDQKMEQKIKEFQHQAVETSDTFEGKRKRMKTLANLGKELNILFDKDEEERRDRFIRNQEQQIVSLTKKVDELNKTISQLRKQVKTLTTDNEGLKAVNSDLEKSFNETFGDSATFNAEEKLEEDEEIDEDDHVDPTQ